MAAIFGKKNMFLKNTLISRDTLRVKTFVEIAHLARFSRYKHFCVLQFLWKIRKFKMAAIFGEIKIFGKIC